MYDLSLIVNKLLFLVGFSIFANVAFSQTVTKTYTAPSSVSVDGCGTYCTNLPGVTFTAADFPSGCGITDVNVSITWAKTDGTCTAPGISNSYHSETNFRIDGPMGTNEILVAPGTYSGNGSTSAVTTVFDQSAATIVGGVDPISGTFRPSTGNLDNYNGVSGIGTWYLRAGDTGTGDPLCIVSYSVTITMAGTPGNPGFNYPLSTYCQSDTDPTAVITGDLGGTFSGDPGLVVNASTGIIDLDASTPGTYSAYYTVPPCATSASFAVTILESPVVVETQSACDTFTWAQNGSTYTLSGVYNDTLLGSAVNGCDSIRSLDLTILNSTSGTDAQTACGAYTWIDGMTYTTSNATATYLLTNAAGCDSLVTLDLIVLPLGVNLTTHVQCDSAYTWAQTGQTYAVTGIYNDTIFGAGANGCDSLVSLDLTIGATTVNNVSELSCGPYLSPAGNVYTTSGSYTELLTSSAGCDSTLIINLIVENLNVGVTSSAETITANLLGASYQWIDCNTLLPIAGQTGQSFTATANGSYAVIVSSSNCSDTSACTTINTIGLSQWEIENSITLYPNPVSGNQIHIAFDGMINEVQVFDLLGRRIDAKLHSSEKFVDISNLNAGRYIMKLVLDSGIVMKEFIVSK